MKLSSLLGVEQVLPGLTARDLRGAVREMLGQAPRLHGGDRAEAIVEAVLHREDQASTALGNRVAIPHARIADLQEFYLLLGIPQAPLDDRGPDGEPVALVFLLVGSNQKNTVILQTMAALATLCSDADRVEALIQAPDREAAWRCIDASGAEVKKGLHARDVMREVEVQATEDMPLRELLDALFEHQVYHAPVCNRAGKVIGAVTAREVLDAGFPDYMSRIPQLDFLSEYEPFEQFFSRETTTRAGNLMDREPVVAQAGDPLIQVVFRLKQHGRLYAYVEEGGRLAGAIGLDDIISRVLRV